MKKVHAYQFENKRTGQRPRKHRRMRAPLLVGDVADGKNVFQAMVEDFSAGGLRMSDIPNSFRIDRDVYTIVISTGKHHFRLMVKPRWQKQNQFGKNREIGFKIIDAPWRWIQLTKATKGSDLAEFGYTA